MRILHPSGGRLSMRFNDLRLHNTDTVQVGTTLTNPASSLLSNIFISDPSVLSSMFEYQKIDEKHDAVFDLLIKICYQVALLRLHTGLGLPAISSLCSNNFIVL